MSDTKGILANGLTTTITNNQKSQQLIDVLESTIRTMKIADKMLCLYDRPDKAREIMGATEMIHDWIDDIQEEAK